MATAYLKTNTVGREVPNFLASEVGLVLKSYQLNKSSYSGSDYFVKAGTVVTVTTGEGSNAVTTPIGIVYQDVDLTDGDKFVSLIIAGRVYEDRLPTGYSAYKSALTAKGIFFDTMPATTRAD